MDVMVENLQYHVEICGTGFPLLLLHGFTGDSSTWTPFCSVWGGHSKLIIPDIIGHGKTEISQDLNRYKMESAARDLNLLFDRLGINQVDVLGYSMGGRLALSFAILYPEKVRKLILESASPGLETEEERKNRCMNDLKLANRIKEHGIESFVDYWEKIPLFSTMEQIPDKTKKVIRQQRLTNSPVGLENSLIGMGTGAQPSWWGNLQLLNCNVLILSGEKDLKFCGIAEKMNQKLKMASWVVVENRGHAIHVEDAEKFGTIVSDFLSNNTKGGVMYDS
ncbi:2-succinyl-6-hydroxy-2,4-cyclohexadiene-1-carboxylate synthase [Bacillus xiapuensis]|uniref:Putative 2-succinyl-6-hydroxy-2,4-cyclohexadiene-1-carboxylate synthase n=1 Tax=Bacillus xiapuensis TaxID=2014075 RepID=A0ABU6N6H4_9BACI|nr:2-succinyl-6-hydroxy-2,4-cyclohexadiene-1-carboxylate synthase [Bacillus xiapuensis]